MNYVDEKVKKPFSPQKTDQQPNDQNLEHLSSQISSDSISVVDQRQKQGKSRHPPSFQKHNYSYIMLVVSCLAWVTGFLYPNEHKMSPFETSISRYTLMFFVTYIHCRINGSPMVFFNRPHEKTLIFRNIIIAFHGFVVAFIQFYLPLATFHTLVISGQVFIFLANYYLKGVTITKRQAICAGISFIGLALTINGRYLIELFNQQSTFESDFKNYASTDTSTQITMGILYVGWNAAWAVSVVYTKMPEYTPSEILFSQTFTSMIIAAIGYIFFDSDSKVEFEFYLPSLLYCSLLIMVANYLFTYGVIWSANTGIASMMFMSSAVFGYILSIFRYNESVNIVSLLGTVILAISAGFVVYQQQKVKH